MRLLDRYIFRELLTPLAFCLVGIQSFIIFVTVFSDGKIEEAKLSFGQTIGYAAAASMNLLTIVIPVAMLLALLMTLTNHTRYNELTAMRAAGITVIQTPVGDKHVYASRTRFIPPKLLGRFDHVAWPAPQREAEPARAEGPRVDLAERMRAMWR